MARGRKHNAVHAADYYGAKSRSRQTRLMAREAHAMSDRTNTASCFGAQVVAKQRNPSLSASMKTLGRRKHQITPLKSACCAGCKY